MKSVLQEWVMNISLRQQGVLIIALRGPDGLRKESPAKPIVRTLRALVMNSGREGKPMSMGLVWKTDSFMSMNHISEQPNWEDVSFKFFDDMDSYNLHFYQHLIHAFAVCGINHPHKDISERCWNFYLDACNRLHVHPEKKHEIEHRLRDGIREGE